MDASQKSPSIGMALDMPIGEKKAFYKQLDGLEVPIEEYDDVSDHARQQSRAFFARAKPGNPEQHAPKNTTFAPSNSSHSSTHPSDHFNACAVPGDITTFIESTPSIAKEAGQTAKRRVPVSASFIQDTPESRRPSANTSLRRTRPTSDVPALGSLSASAQQQASSTMPGSSKRRRSVKGKANSTPAIVETEQMLKGLRLFYIPGERIKLRKQRMERAEMHGAVVTRELSEATHVVVDENLTYDNIKPHVSLVAVKDKPTIVTDQWPLECIQRKFVFLPSRKFRPKGTPTEEPAPVQEPPSVPLEATDGSLELRTYRNKRNRWDYESPETTQSGASSARPVDRIEGSGELNQPKLQQTIGAGPVSAPSSANPGASEADGEVDRAQQQSAQLLHSDSAFGDDLAQIVHQVRENFRDVPRIGEEDANHDGEGDKEGIHDSGTDEEHGKKRRKVETAKRIGKQTRRNEKFRCHTGGTRNGAAEKENPNALAISVLKRMANYYTQTNDRWRPIAYRRAITELEGITDRKISTAEEAMELPCFGPRLADKLEEIVNTHSLSRLEYAINDPISKVLALFLGIYGVGKSTADKWIARGFRTLDDLLQKAKLTDNQRMGIDHYQDLNTRIPREEVTRLGDYLKAEAARIDQTVHLLIGGSYRRGADTSGDIDFIITKEGTTSSRDLRPFLDQLVGNLWRQGFLTAEVASHSSHKDSDGSKWHGCCVLPRIAGFNDDENYRPIWRRIDLLLVPESEYGAALIYFTGNDIFNRSLRLLASRRGMRLNQRGLYKDVMRSADRQKLTEGELLEGRDETKIFEILNVKWREPSERWC